MMALPTDGRARVLTKATAGATLLLVFIGSLVTSTGSGLAVPDWPLSYGMLFPPMVGGILYEHGHRMAAAAVGLLVVIQALVLSWRESRRWVRVLAWLAVAVIMIQGGLGGLTVLLLLPTPISMTHAVLAQSLLLLLVYLAYTQSHEWRARGSEPEGGGKRSLPVAAAVLVAAVYLQLLFGALMRHTESGLAIPDFPLMGGQLLPRFDDRMLGHVNAARFSLLLEPATRAQVVIHFLHRLGAAVTGVAVVLANRAVHRSGGYPAARRLLNWINAGIVLQALLGVLTVLTARVPLIASLHVLLGASLLAVALLFLVRCTPLPTRARLSATSATQRHGQRRHQPGQPQLDTARQPNSGPLPARRGAAAPGPRTGTTASR